MFTYTNDELMKYIHAWSEKNKIPGMTTAQEYAKHVVLPKSKVPKKINITPEERKRRSEHMSKMVKMRQSKKPSDDKIVI